MGMYDEIKGEVICPYCKQKTTVDSQIKWMTRELRSLHIYHVGENIPCVDAIYTGASTVRPFLKSICKNCLKYINFTVTVKDGKVISIDPIMKEEVNNETA